MSLCPSYGYTEVELLGHMVVDLKKFFEQAMQSCAQGLLLVLRSGITHCGLSGPFRLVEIKLIRTLSPDPVYFYFLNF